MMNAMPMPPYNAGMYPPMGMGGGVVMGRPFVAQPTTLYVGNLDEAVHEEQLFSHFSRYGQIHSLKIVAEKSSGKSRGFGYINFSNAKDADSARMLSQYEKIGKNPIRLMYKRDPKSLASSNIFVKNIDPSVTFKELHNFFTPAGNVLTVKINTNKQGESLGYGYVQFDKPEDADKAIEQFNGQKLKEQEIVLEKFVPKGERNITENKNLYVKHLPTGKTKQQIEALIAQEFSKYGKILSQMASQKDDKWFAFICFEDPDSARAVIDNLNEKDIFGTGEPLYVTYHQSRYQRDEDLKQKAKQVQSDKNLYVKNLKPETSDQDLKAAFSQFGEIDSVAVHVKSLGNESRGMGFINFKEPRDAKTAQSEGHNVEEIRKFFINNQPYISFVLTKDQLEQFRHAKANMNPSRRIFNTALVGGPGGMYGQPGHPAFNMPGRVGGFNPMMQQNFNQRRPFFNGQPQMPLPNQQQQQQMQQPQQQRAMAKGKGPLQGRGMGPNPQGGFGQNVMPRQQQHQGGRFNPNMGGAGRSGPYQGSPQNRGPRGPNQQHPHQQAEAGQREEIQEQKHKQPKEGQQVLNVSNLKSKLDDFLKLDPERQRNILGELLYPKIIGVAGPSYAPKITGMLVDFDVLTVQDIFEMLEDEQVLRERISEAQELIEQEGEQ